MPRAWRDDAGEGEILEENTEFLVMCVIGGGWKAGSGRRIVDDSDGGVGPRGGGGGETERKFDVVAEGQHVRTRRPSTKPSLLVDQQTGAETPGHRVATGRQSLSFFKVVAGGTEGAGQRPGDGFGNFLKLFGRVDQKRGDEAGRVFDRRGQQRFKILGCEDGIIVHDQQVREIGKSFEGELAGDGESAPEAEVLAG